MSASDPIFSSVFKQNPYPAYRSMAVNEPMRRMTTPNGRTGWMVANYDLALQVLKDERFVKDARTVYGAAALGRLTESHYGRVFSQHILVLDPPDHTRLRALVAKAFTPRLMGGLAPRVQQIADELIDKVADQRQMELIGDYAFPLPIIVILEMLGIPTEDRDKFREWSHLVVSVSDNLAELASRLEALNNFVAYISDLFVKRRKEPKDDLITALANAEIDGQLLSEDECYAMVILLIIAGHETTTNLIGNGLLALLQNPDQLALLKADPTRIGTAVEELLRYDGPVEWTTIRWARENLEFGGQQIVKGEAVYAVLAAADHDAAHFNSPEHLDILRERNNHLAFGQGIHYCLGAPLARIEGQIAINTLLRRLPDIKLATSPEALEWRVNFILRGLVKLPVTF